MLLEMGLKHPSSVITVHPASKYQLLYVTVVSYTLQLSNGP